MSDLGAHAIGDFLIDFVSLPALGQSQITWPITINVGTKEQASTRIPNPSVTTAMLITENAKVQREASQELRRGQTEQAKQRIQNQIDHMTSSANAKSYEQEINHLNKILAGIEREDANRMSKSLYEDSNLNIRGRNRDYERQSRSRGKRDF
jgi:hypothetical protein